MFLSCIGVRSGLWTTYRYTNPDGDDIGATDEDTPSGRLRSGMRSNTCCRAKYVSVRSSNVIVTSDRPYSETERMTFRFGVPFMPASTGTVISRSTSSAAWPGHWDMISTIGGETSGYASTGSREKDHAPTPINTIARIPVNSGCASDAATTRFTNDCAVPSIEPGSSICGSALCGWSAPDPSDVPVGSGGVTGSPRTAGTTRPLQPRDRPHSARTVSRSHHRYACQV